MTVEELANKRYNNGRMQSGHIIIDGIGLFKQIIHER